MIETLTTVVLGVVVALGVLGGVFGASVCTQTRGELWELLMVWLSGVLGTAAAIALWMMWG